MADLTTVSAVKRQLGIGTTTDDDLIGAYVTQASQFIETHCRRQFTESLATLKYDALTMLRGGDIRGRTLYLGADVLHVISIVNSTNGTLDPSTYVVKPNNASPKYAVELLQSSGLYWQTSDNGDYQQAITVTGSIGYCYAANRPADITLAATKLAAWFYQNRDNDGAQIQAADGTLQVPAEAPTFVLRLIDKYVRPQITA